jgi:hypothetical protein
MKSARLALLASLCLLCAACGTQAHHRAVTGSSPTAPAHPKTATVKHVVVGIGDNKPEMLGDPRFLALGITQVRLDIPWDVLQVGYERTGLAQWLAKAHADGLTPLVTFDHSGRPGERHTLPSVAQYNDAFLAFHRLYPWVTQFVTWDESNFSLEPTATSRRVLRGAA